jgi:hypothetical protein
MAQVRYAVPFENGTSKGKFGFMASAEAYTGVATVLGVETVSDTEIKNVMMNLDADDIPVGRVCIHYEAAGKKRSARLFYDPTKPIATVCNALIGETYKGGKITGANPPRRRVYV